MIARSSFRCLTGGRRGRNFAALLAIGLAASIQAGCLKDRLYETGNTVSLIDGAAIDAPTDAGADKPASDTRPGTGGRLDAGGTGGMGGTDASMPGTGGAAPTCSDTSPDRQTDLLNCGKCGNACPALPSAAPTCVAGVCGYECLLGTIDADKMASNGCECTPTVITGPDGGTIPEVCDGIDNDCNGVVDDGFDLMTDMNNCGGCNKPCFIPFATSACVKGACTMVACLPDFYDRDPNIPGCETSCQKTNGGVEICDGLDNDCDGTVDNNVAPATITCKSKGVCAGVTPRCMGAAGYTCTYPSTYQDLEDTTKGCDGLDNDCDGNVDEPFAIGKSCIVGSGPCAGTGTWVCDNTQPGNRRCNGSMLPSTPEVCDGKDNDCDGKIDELDKLSDSNDKLVTFTTGGNTVVMFAYEASRYDSTSTDSGFDSTRRPCSLGGKLPWSNVTKEEAEAACEAIGKDPQNPTVASGWRLCTAAEWLDACNGSANTTFPYGANYSKTACNGYDYTKAAGQTTIPTGSDAMCISDQSTAAGDEMYDMSGNVKEWVATDLTTKMPTSYPTCTTPPCLFELRGGAYNIPSFVDNSVSPSVTRAPGLQCDASTPAPTGPVRLPSVGFRCCHPGALPP